MRKIVLCVAASVGLLGATASQAADLDYDVLRGPAEDVYVAPIDWSGIYVGGHGGYSAANVRPGRTLDDFTATSLAPFGYSLNGGPFVPPSTNVRATTYGAFAGYNIQLDDVVVGVEGDYTHGELRGVASDTLVEPGTTSLARSSTVSVTDYGTVRARAGYVVGSFLPFATAGLAVARLQENNVIGNIIDASGAVVAPTARQRTSERYTFGFTIGAGIDFALTDNIVLRGEYQYVQLDDYTRNGKQNLIEISTFRGGAALKF